ncbi:MAG: spore germination protein [Bacillota bacterium]|nr:spore germination protein [Bacillota bacterium]
MRKIPKKPLKSNPIKESDPSKIPAAKLPMDIEDKQELLKPYLENSDDIINRTFYINGSELEVQAIFINGVIDDNTFHLHILKPLMLHCETEPLKNRNNELIDIVSHSLITVGRIRKADSLDALIHDIYDGMLVLIFDSSGEYLAIDIHGGPLRSLEEPPVEKAQRGSRDGFIEILDINLALLRRRIRDHRLVVNKTLVGKRTRTPLAIIYIEDIADPGVIEEVNARINQIDIDGPLAAGYIEQFIEDNHYSFFPQIWATERPDKMIAELLEGRVAIMIDGTPQVLFAPSLFVEFLQAPEDYYERPWIGSYVRALRFLAFFIAITFPALYISLMSYQIELIPIDLLVPLAKARKLVPFPVLVEIILMEIIIQVVIETGVRLPGTVGQTIGMVAGIILGQAAISANLATPGVIIVIAITTISTFSLPSSSLALATRILRLPMIMMASIFGLFGFSLGMLIIIAHLASLESFGVPYFAPFAPTRFADLKDSVFRTFLWKMNQRPVSIPGQDKKRQGNNGQGR